MDAENLREHEDGFSDVSFGYGVAEGADQRRPAFGFLIRSRAEPATQAALARARLALLRARSR